MWLGATTLWNARRGQRGASAQQRNASETTTHSARAFGAAEHTCCRRALARHFCILLLPLLQDVNHKLQRVVRLRLQELSRDVLEHNAQIPLVDPLHCIRLCSPGVLPMLCASSGSALSGQQRRALVRGALSRSRRAATRSMWAGVCVRCAERARASHASRAARSHARTARSIMRSRMLSRLTARHRPVPRGEVHGELAFNGWAVVNS